MEKRFYTIAEVVEMGFSHWELCCACHIQGQTFATKAGTSARSKWRIDLAKYMEFRQLATKKAAES